jgi:hypothetical protein
MVAGLTLPPELVMVFDGTSKSPSISKNCLNRSIKVFIIYWRVL